MNPHTQGESPGVPRDIPDTYMWDVPGQPAAVHFPLDVIDRLSAELMRGYGANPKRNPEVGGILIGSVQLGSPVPNSPPTIRIEAFEVVPCPYRLGPSYIFAPEDYGPFERASGRAGTIGYFRSNTREDLSLGVEDVELLDRFFTGPHKIALLVRPYATKAGVAGIFFRENGVFPAATPQEFPFRRQELTGQEPPVRRSLIDRRPRRPMLNPGAVQSVARYAEPDAEAAGNLPPAENASPVELPGFGVVSDKILETAYRNPSLEKYSPSIDPQAGPTDRGDEMARTQFRNSWVWMPLSFLFLLFGLAMGFEGASLYFGSHPATTSADFTLSLVVTKTGQNLSVKWDGQSPAVRASHRGVLEIEEKGVTKPVDLDGAQLQNGTLTYRNATGDVHFRLTVFPKDQVRVMESAEWRE